LYNYGLAKVLSTAFAKKASVIRGRRSFLTLQVTMSLN